MRHKEIEAFHPSCLSQTKESIRHLLSLTTTNHNYNVDARTYTSGQIITVAAAVYHGEDSIVFALCIFNNRVFRLFRVPFDTRYPNISSYIPFLAVYAVATCSACSVQEQLNLLKVVGAQLTNKTHFYCEKLNSYEHL